MSHIQSIYNLIFFCILLHTNPHLLWKHKHIPILIIINDKPKVWFLIRKTACFNNCVNCTEIFKHIKFNPNAHKIQYLTFQCNVPIMRTVQQDVADGLVKNHSGYSIKVIVSRSESRHKGIARDTHSLVSTHPNLPKWVSCFIITS